MENIWNDICNFFSSTGLKILLVICLLILGGIVIHYFVKLFKNLLYRTSMDDSVVSFVASLLKIILWILLILILAGILDLSASSLLVCLSSLALAVGLALKDSVANLANGLFIIYNKPFKRGDLVNINGVEGKVQNIKLLTTELVSLDNRKLIIPNSSVNSESVINYYAMPTRRVDKTFSVAYGSDANLVIAIIKEVLAHNEMVLKYPESNVFMSAHSSSSVDFTIWTWVSTEDYWPLWCIIQQEVYEAFYKYGISIPFPQVDVHFDEKNKKVVKYPKPDNYNEIMEMAKNKEERIKLIQENEKQQAHEKEMEYLKILEAIKNSSAEIEFQNTKNTEKKNLKFSKNKSTITKIENTNVKEKPAKLLDNHLKTNTIAKNDKIKNTTLQLNEKNNPIHKKVINQKEIHTTNQDIKSNKKGVKNAK